MDSSDQECLYIEPQRSTVDVRRKRRYSLTNLIDRGISCMLGFLKNGGEGTKSVSELLANLRFSDIFAFPGVYVPMRPEIFSAVSAGKQECLEMIRSYGKPMACLKSDQGDSVLHLAAAWGHLELFKSIVSECPCLLLELDSRGQIPLHVAARAGHAPVVEALVEIETIVSAKFSAEDKERENVYLMKDIHGDTPLHALSLERHSYEDSYLSGEGKPTGFVSSE